VAGVPEESPGGGGKCRQEDLPGRKANGATRAGSNLKRDAILDIGFTVVCQDSFSRRALFLGRDDEFEE